MLTERLRQCYTGIIQDVLRARGLPHQCLPHGIVALSPEMRLAGPVFTLSGEPCHTLSEREILLLWTGFLSAAAPGTVVVCQPNDSTVAHLGELSAETLASKGVLGFVVDGGCRDVGFIRSLGFPTFCRYHTPADIVGQWKVTAMGQPIHIGEVTIEPGDYILGDEDGVIVIPHSLAEPVIRDAETMMRTESQVRKAIRAGVDPQQAYLQYGKF